MVRHTATMCRIHISVLLSERQGTIRGQTSTDDISCPSIKFQTIYYFFMKLCNYAWSVTENKNLNHTFSSDMNMPLYLICFGSLYPLNNSVTDWSFFFFFFLFFWSGRGGGAVVICSPYRRCENIMFWRCPSVWLSFDFFVSMPYLTILSK